MDRYSGEQRWRFSLEHAGGIFTGRMEERVRFECDERISDVPYRFAGDAQRSLGTDREPGRGGSGARVWTGEDQRVCRGEGGGGGVVALTGAGRSEKRN